MSLPVAGECLLGFKTSIDTSAQVDSPSLNSENVDVPVFIRKSNFHHKQKQMNNDTVKDSDYPAQGGDSDDELLTVHFGEATTASVEDPIEVSSDENSEGVVLVCGICTAVCSDMQSLKKHERTHEAFPERDPDKDVLFVCSVCTVVCENLSALKQHEMIHTDRLQTTTLQTMVSPEGDRSKNNMFACSFCSMVCESLHSLKCHEMTHLENMSALYSDVRDTVFSDTEVSENSTFVCSVCSVVCTNWHSLQRHEMTHIEKTQMAYSDLQSASFSEARASENSMYTCGVCSMVFNTIQSLARHEIMHSDDRPYKCTYCNYAGKHKEHLIAHIKSHTRERQFKCPHCDYMCVKSHSLKLHLQFHTNKYPHKCTMCLYSTESLGSLTSHYKNHHLKIVENTGVKELDSSEPDRCKDTQVLSSHLHVQTKRYKCEYCDYSSRKSYSLKKHIQAHTDAFPNKCQLCLYSTASPGNLTSHYKNHHLSYTEHQNVSPDINESSEPNSNICLEEVNLSVGSLGKVYKCPYCDYEGQKPCKIREHLQYHTNKLAHKCRFCVYSTAKFGNLLYHYKHHHYSNPEAVKAFADESEMESLKAAGEKNRPNLHFKIVPPESKKLLKCQQCEYSSVKPYRIKEHSVFHTYQHPNKCHLCVFSTVNAGNLTAHYKHHHSSVTAGMSCFDEFLSIKPNIHISQTYFNLKNLTVSLERVLENSIYFVCDVCNKYFMKKSLMAEHKKTHLEACTYKCDICECQFFESKLLENHKESHQSGREKQQKDCTKIRNNSVLSKTKLRTVKSCAMRSALKKAKITYMKQQLKGRRQLLTNQISRGDLQVICKPMLIKLHKCNLSEKKKVNDCINLSKKITYRRSLKKRESAPETAEAIQQQSESSWSLKNCTVKLVNTAPEIPSKVRLYKCLSCEFVDKTSDGLKKHTESHHKVKTSAKSNIGTNHINETDLKPHNECDNREGEMNLILENKSCQKARLILKMGNKHLTTDNEPSLKKIISLKSDGASCLKKKLGQHLQAKTKGEMYACHICKYTCTSAEELAGHLEAHPGTEKSHSRLDERAGISVESHYSCDLCDFSCSQVSLLRQHLGVHREEKKHVLHHQQPENWEENASSSKNSVLFKCVICQCRSADVESMTKHMLVCNTKKGLW